jgi:ribose transport system substrate-binding protein
VRKAATKRLYLIPILSKALDILELLQSTKKPLSLESVHQTTRISKTTVYRILKTLVHRGYVAHSQDGLYRQVARPKKLCFGFGSQSADMPFSQVVTESLKEAAAVVGVDLMILDNRYDAASAVKNAEEFVKHGVDLVIEFQVEQRVAPIIADKIAEANIPLIALDIPHPHATYFGVDNYRVGYAAGEVLAKYALDKWDGRMHWMLGLDIEDAGTLVQSRITGAFEAVRAHLKEVPVEAFVRVDGRGLRETSQKAVYDFLQRHPKDKNILIAAANDTSALGALAAVRELKREKHVAIVGQDCIDEMVTEIQDPASAAIGTISHEAHTYGANLIHLGLAILRGQTVPPYNYSEHRVVTSQNGFINRVVEQKAVSAGLMHQ